MKGFFAAIAALAVASVASGALYQFNSTNLASDFPGSNTNAGTVSNLATTYDSASSMFTWNVTFSDGVAKDTDGFWLVVGPGPNPKGHAWEYAIMYFDGSSLANPNVTIYRYNGLNADTSFTTPGDLLATTKNIGQTTIQNVTATSGSGARTFGFKVNAAVINSLYGPSDDPDAIDWKGVQFGSHIGVWFHPVSGLQTSYGSISGKLKTFTYKKQGWYDGNDTPTREVPAPSSAALIALGGLVAARRRR